MTSTPHLVGTILSLHLLDTDSGRKSFAVFNKHAAAIVYMKEGREVSATNGIPIYPRGNISLSLLEDGRTVTEPWSFISDTLATPIVIFEGSE